ncbi:MAG: hypothetical protein K0S58_2452 [Nitrospira sp.]|jgi:hypothetical protein|nr:hypothetical protein [Nitrospira sp.]
MAMGTEPIPAGSGWAGKKVAFLRILRAILTLTRQLNWSRRITQ